MALEDWYNKGLTFEQYRDGMRLNRQEMQQIYDSVEFQEDDLTLFKHAAWQDWKGIVLTADWCGDAALSVPIIQRIAELCGMELRFLIRDDNLELMDQYLTNGTSRMIPIFIFLDAEGQEQFVWGPRSPEMQKWLDALKEQLPPIETSDYREAQQNMYRTIKQRIASDPEAWRSVIRSIKPLFIKAINL